ncbi:MAG: hypothetical protein AAGD92_17030 [Pseudomonadota bacterium]
MLSENEEQIFTADAESSAEESAPERGRSRQTQPSIQDFLRRPEGKRSKRMFSPPDATGGTPSAKRRSTKPSVGLSDLTPECLDAIYSKIQCIIESNTAKTISAVNARFDSLEKRLEVLEGENFEKSQTIDSRKGKLETQELQIKQLQAQVEGIDANRRLSSLILTWEDFKVKRQDENIVIRAVDALNKRLPGLNIGPSEIDIAHRLQSDDKVIVKFVHRTIRHRIYERRFELFPEYAPNPSAHPRCGASGSARPSPLFLQESLTAANGALYHELVRAKKRENGAIVASVFSRRGVVWCRKVKKGPNICVRDE